MFFFSSQTQSNCFSRSKYLLVEITIRFNSVETLSLVERCRNTDSLGFCLSRSKHKLRLKSNYQNIKPQSRPGNMAKCCWLKKNFLSQENVVRSGENGNFLFAKPKMLICFFIIIPDHHKQW